MKSSYNWREFILIEDETNNFMNWSNLIGLPRLIDENSNETIKCASITRWMNIGDKHNGFAKWISMNWDITGLSVYSNFLD